MASSSILVVDDEEVIRSTLREYFAEFGYTVHTAVDGVDALKQFVPGGFDCIISDMAMPNMNGLDLLKRIRQHDKRVGFLMITGYPDIDSALDSIKEGASDYVHKPFHMEDMRIKVERTVSAVRREKSIKSMTGILWALVISIPIWLTMGIILGLIWK